MTEFSGRTAVVTGGAQGIGGAVVKRLASAGAEVAIWDLDVGLARKMCAEVGNRSMAVEVDITDQQAVNAALEATLGSFGRIDVLVNSAGIAGLNETVESYPLEEFERIVAVNLVGAFIVNKAVIPHMKAANYGRIVNIASIAGKEGNPNASAYSASKAGVIGLTKSVGKELAGYNIAVNCVTPAAARTRIFDQMSEEHIEFMLSKIPRNRFLELEEAASLIAWLASEENSFTTAGVFDLSGGRATY